jgi:hypothetical protein
MNMKAEISLGFNGENLIFMSMSPLGVMPYTFLGNHCLIYCRYKNYSYHYYI